MLEDFPTYMEVESAGSANSIVWELRDAEIKRIKDSAINQALETIRNRIDQFGVAEPLIQRQGLKQVVVQLPGIKDAKLAKDLIKQTALLKLNYWMMTIRRSWTCRVGSRKGKSAKRRF